MNFPAILRKVKSSGAFNDFDPPIAEIPLEDVKREINTATIHTAPNLAYALGDLETAKNQPHMDLRVPRYPGDQVLRFAAPVISVLSVHIPQALMDAQHKAFFDAIRLYMPDQDMAEWTRHYFNGDFLASASFAKLAGDITFRDPYSRRIDRATLDNDLSFKLDDLGRTVCDRRVFTQNELIETVRVSKDHPALIIAVLAFQANFLEYITEFGTASETSENILDPRDRERAVKFSKNLKRQYLTDNFVGNMLPAIIICHRTHDPNYAEAFTEKDFTEAVHFINKNGAFRHDIETPDKKTTVKLSCPFQQMFTKTSKISLKDDILGKDGSSLFQIYQSINDQIAAGHAPALKAVGLFKDKAMAMLQSVQEHTDSWTGAALDCEPNPPRGIRPR